MTSKRDPEKRQSMIETHSQADLHQLLVPSSFDDVPAVSRKESPSSPSRTSSHAESYFVPESLSRTTSVFSFSRASFSSQLASLTSMSLPRAESLAASIAGLPTAPKAIKALTAAADQIQQWTKKALKVLENLDADDDVEWAAAAGRDGLDDTDKCINKFENLISVYVQAIEELQSRPDIGDIKPEELGTVVEQMEVVLEGWDNVRLGLKRIHDQVELAMEWEELWGTVLGDVGNELDKLSQLVFEMEEKRHTALFMPKQMETQNVDLNELEGIIDGPAKTSSTPNNRFSLVPTFESSSLGGSPVIDNSQDDSDLLALFARMQPLRASLDFLPMRLSMFNTRADSIFPQACQELYDKRERLEKNWSQLSKEAESLRRELSEDRWVTVFRNAGRQAQKMVDSIERSIEKVQEAIEAGYERSNPTALTKRIESFEAKKLHYGPAIQRVLTIVKKGITDRLTINGEIIRLHKDMSAKAHGMSEMMEDMESLLEMMNTNHNSRLRESISSVLSTNRSFSSTTFVDTPVSSPASSVDLAPHRNEAPMSKYGMNGYSKPRAPSATRPPMTITGRRSSVQPPGRQPYTPLHSQSVQHVPRRAPSPGPASVYRKGAYHPPTAPLPPRATPTKPRWSSVAKTSDPPVGPGSRSSSFSATSPFNKMTPRPISRTSSTPFRSPLSRATSVSPSALATPSTTRHSSQQFRSFAERVASPSPPRNGGILDPVPYHRGRNITAPVAGTIRSPSSLAYHENSRPSTSSNASTAHATSALSNTTAPGQSMPLRTSTERARPSHKSEDSAIDLEADDLDSEDGRSTDQGPSPPIRPMMVPRPVSVLAVNGKGKRMSMLPVPKIPGRQSSLGSR